MTDRVILSLAIHNHQPVGNFPHVFEAAYAQSYLPMLRLLERHPRIRIALHYSGPLLDWLELAHPEFFPPVRSLAETGQVELMTGGYYEPILAIIPERDRAGQIRKLTAYLQARFGARPTGLWLAERVWEPHLAGAIAASGVAYTIVDDAHFLAAGLRPEQLRGHFVTEDGGMTLSVFPSLHALRYLIPWKPVAEVIAFLRAHAASTAPVLLMGDDGEKFGHWPGTYAHCWEAGWMEEFFSALEAASDWLQVLPPGEAVARPAAGRVYLPTASYEEMEEWALPAETGREYAEVRARLLERDAVAARYLRGGFWRQFLVKYPEINTMHKKMLQVSAKVWALPPGHRQERALDELWQGQCNCPYWHGVFGGVYLPHIRRANFAHLIAAEAMADEIAPPATTARVADLDGDAAFEVELASRSMVIWIDPDDGGGVVAWDWRSAAINLVNVLSRRPEAYHRRLLEAQIAEAGASGTETIHTTRVRVKERGLERLLTYDAYRRAGFLDHLLPADTTIERFAAGEVPLPFAGQPYAVMPPRSGRPVQVGLTREAAVDLGGGPSTVRIDKEYTLDDAQRRLEVTCRVTNTAAAQVRGRFGVEINWALTDPASTIRAGEHSHPAGEMRRAEGVERFELFDHGWPGPVVLAFPAAECWLLPLLTVSSSEAGFERTFQGLSCLCVWPLLLDPGAMWETTVVCALPSR